MSPPELAADAPVLNGLQPVAVSVDIFVGIELHLTFHHWFEGNLSEMLHLEEPLQGKPWLNSRVRVALRITHLVGVVFDALHQSCFLEVLGNLLAAIHSVHTHIERTLVRDGGIGIEDIDGLEMVCLTQHIVVGVVSGSDLQTSGTELNIHITVLNHRDDAVHKRHNNLATFQPLVFGIFGVDAHGGVAHDGLRACGGHNSIVSFLILVDDVSSGFQFLLVVKSLQAVHIVFQMEKVALLLLIHHFLGGDGGEGLRIPVDHAQVAIDVSFIVEVNEDLDHTLGTCLVHGESRAVPVARCTETSELLEDDASMLACPVPCMSEELITRQVVFLDALLSEFLHHLGFGGDTGMVCSRHPKGVFSVHSGTSDQNVLYGVVEHMSHVQDTRHVRRRYNYSVRFTIVGL